MNSSQLKHSYINITADHPSLAGHFPGNPVVPGVVILDQVRQCIEEWKHSSIAASALKSVKFLSPLVMSETASQSLSLVLEEKQAGSAFDSTRIEFRCLKGEELIVQGQWVFQADLAQ